MSDCISWWMYLWRLRIRQHLAHLYSRHEKSETDLTAWSKEPKATVWYDVDTNGVVGPYYSNIKTVRGGDYFRIRNTYVQSEPKKFSHSNVFLCFGRMELLFLLLAPSVLFCMNCSQNLGIGSYVRAGWPPICPNATPLDVSNRIRKRSRVSSLCAKLNDRQPKNNEINQKYQSGNA